MTTAFNAKTFAILGAPQVMSLRDQLRVQGTESRLGLKLPAAMREWYGSERALDILAAYSNDDRPLAVDSVEFAISRWNGLELLPFKVENQGVCVWAVAIDGTDDPPVYVSEELSGGTEGWQVSAPSFSEHVFCCVWDRVCVHDQLAFADAQAIAPSPNALEQLRRRLTQHTTTYGFPAHSHYRFGNAVLSMQC